MLRLEVYVVENGFLITEGFHSDSHRYAFPMTWVAPDLKALAQQISILGEQMRKTKDENKK